MTAVRITRAALLAAPAAIAIGALVMPAHPAQAVPAFAEQTGLPCQACHVGGFGPQLTPLGRDFKLNGYTMRAKGFNVPLSAMAVFSTTHTKADQNPPPTNLDANDNTVLDQASLFIAGGIGQHFGGFSQITYDGVARHWSWDNTDIRAVTKGRVLGEDATFGLTLNNNPTVQDAFNTTPAWGFPYTDTAVSNTPGAAPLVDGALAGEVLGLSGYAWIGQKLLIEAGGYTTPKAGTLTWLGADPVGPGSIHGIAPYWRVAYQRPLAGGTAHVGAFGLEAALYPERDRSSGFSDHYSDIGVDASWQKPTGKGDVVSAQVRYVHELSDLKASCALGIVGTSLDPGCARTRLNEVRGDVSYSFRNRLGLTLAAFSTSGGSNSDLYGGPNASPDSNGMMGEIDYTPWGNGNGPLGPRANLRLGLQYTAYGKFDGARHNYDGAGASASDNNALRVFAWLAF